MQNLLMELSAFRTLHYVATFCFPVLLIAHPVGGCLKHRKSFLNTILLGVEWVAADGAARSAVFHIALTSTVCIMHPLVELIFFVMPQFFEL
jgi:hypothetical protein